MKFAIASIFVKLTWISTNGACRRRGVLHQAAILSVPQIVPDLLGNNPANVAEGSPQIHVHKHHTGYQHCFLVALAEPL